MNNTKNIDLTRYLPTFLKDYKELLSVPQCENPEFVLLWDAAQKTLKNAFIETADEYGLSRFEQLLGILPSTYDTIESRRSRVASRWFNELPYTMKMFIKRLKILCGDKSFSITKDYDKYFVKVDVDLELFGQVEELERIVLTMFPCNIVFELKNTIPCNALCTLYTGGGICCTSLFFITNDEQKHLSIPLNLLNSGRGYDILKQFITNDEQQNITLKNIPSVGGGVVNFTFITAENH